ncbi:MAG: hypothetical protein P1V20_06355 [Verrucomicrobiales bacterium]|nr:hypothetical protein [Verrucomicrobiales bacterium]
MAIGTGELYSGSIDPHAIGSGVSRASIQRLSGALLISLRNEESGWESTWVIPPPWTFTSCLLSVSSNEVVTGTGESTPAEELIGLEGAQLSAIERQGKRIDLVFDSIRVSLQIP